MNAVKTLLTVIATITLSILSIPGAIAQNARSELGEVVVTDQGIGTLRLNATNSAGGRLGLSPFDTPASVDVITKDEIAAKGDYSTEDAVTRAAGITMYCPNT